MSRGTQELPRVNQNFAYWIITIYDRPFHTVPLFFINPTSGSYNPHEQAHGFGLFRVRSPLLTESQLISIPGGTEMFHFPPFAFITYELSNK